LELLIDNSSCSLSNDLHAAENIIFVGLVEFLFVYEKM
jgi:hypothetical protein